MWFQTLYAYFKMSSPILCFLYINLLSKFEKNRSQWRDWDKEKKRDREREGGGEGERLNNWLHNKALYYMICKSPSTHTRMNTHTRTVLDHEQEINFFVISHRNLALLLIAVRISRLAYKESIFERKCRNC